MLEPIFSEIFGGIAQGLRSNNSTIRKATYWGIFILGIGALFLIAAFIYSKEEFSESLNKNVLNPNQILSAIAVVLVLIGILTSYLASKVEKLEKQESEKEAISQKEKRLIENPKETQTAWELARIKLEDYLNKNIAQVSSIFWLSTIVSIVGLGLIIWGAYKVYQDPKNFDSSIVVAISGVLVNFIGASILILYKSTMEQAKTYVEVLERINAVGMSVQVMNTISDEQQKLKDDTRADIAQKLLDLYGSKSVSKFEKSPETK